MSAVAMLLLLTVGAAEQTYGPYARPARGGNHALASAQGNALLAWSQHDAAGRARVHVVLLDANGRAVSPLSVLPALMPNRDALVPSVASDGESFLVLWDEAFGLQQTVAMAVDANGLPSGAANAIGYDRPVEATPYEPRPVSWNGSEYVVVTTRTNGIRVARDASVVGMIVGSTSVPQAFTSEGGSAAVWITSAGTYLGGGFPYGAIFGPPYRYTVWMSVRRPNEIGRGATEPTDLYVPSTPSVVAAGKDFVATWSAGGIVYYRKTEGGRSIVHADVDERSRPDAACTAERCIIAYATRAGDVHGFAFDPAMPDAREHFTIAASERIEGEVQVVMLTNTRALVTYRSSGIDGERLAGRVVFFETPKQRTVR